MDSGMVLRSKKELPGANIFDMTLTGPTAPRIKLGISFRKNTIRDKTEITTRKVAKFILQIDVIETKNIPRGRFATSDIRRIPTYVKLSLGNEIRTTPMKWDQANDHLEHFHHKLTFHLSSINDLNGKQLLVAVCDGKRVPRRPDGGRNHIEYGSTSINMESLKVGWSLTKWYYLYSIYANLNAYRATQDDAT